MANFLKNNDTKSTLERIRSLSSQVDSQVSKLSKNDSKKLEKLSFEELQDLNQILSLADFVLCKYEDKKEFHSLLKDFVDIITVSTNSMVTLNDDIDELVVSGEGALNRIKDLQTTLSENYSVNLDKKEKIAVTPQGQKTSANNLTKSSTAVYTQGYQAKPTLETGQVI